MADPEAIFNDAVVMFRGRELEAKQATLSNGAVVTRLGGRSMPARFYFSYNDQEFEFLFVATRWGEDIQPCDTWQVGFELDALPATQKTRLSGFVLERLQSSV